MAICNMVARVNSKEDDCYSGELPCELEEGHSGWHQARLLSHPDEPHYNEFGISIGERNFAKSDLLVQWQPIRLGKEF